MRENLTPECEKRNATTACCYNNNSESIWKKAYNFTDPTVKLYAFFQKLSQTQLLNKYKTNTYMKLIHMHKQVQVTVLWRANQPTNRPN